MNTKLRFLLIFAMLSIALSACAAKPSEVASACAKQGKSAGESVTIRGNDYYCPTRGLGNLTTTGGPVATAQPGLEPTDQPGNPSSLGLKYDETECDSNLVACRNPGQDQFPAVHLRNVQSGNKTVAQAIVLIQQMAATASAPTWDKWTEHVADPVYATLVWCPAGNCTYPPDSAFPLLNIGDNTDDWKVAIVSAHLPRVPEAGQTKVLCPQGDCWAVLLR